MLSLRFSTRINLGTTLRTQSRRREEAKGQLGGYCNNVGERCWWTRVEVVKEVRFWIYF